MSFDRPEDPTRVQILNIATKLTHGDRNRTYGPPFDNLTDCATLWSAYISARYKGESAVFGLSAEDVAWMNVLQKMARSFQAGFHKDNYIDAAAYAAIAGECREIEDALTWTEEQKS